MPPVRMLAQANHPASAEGIASVNCTAAFNYLWNTYSLAVERGNLTHETFAGWLAPPIAQALQSKVAVGIQRMRPNEVEPHMALWRLLRYLEIPAPIIPLKVKNFVRRHAPQANGESLLVRHFFTRGLAELGITATLIPIAPQAIPPSRIIPAIERIRAEEGFLSSVG